LNMLGDKMYPYFDEFLASIVTAKQIEIEDIRAIRTVLSEETAVSRVIIEQLLEVDRAVHGGTDWRDFLAETIADFVVWVEGRLGEVSAESSAWLIKALCGPTGIPAPCAASVIHAAIAEAEEVDSSLTLFALSTPCASSWASPSTKAWRNASDFVM
jgi:hypothetical protein